MNIQSLIDHFEKYIPLNIQEIEALEARITERRVKRRQFILHEGDICTHFAFVVKGCLKMYKVDEGGKEHNLQFAPEEHWIGDMGSFYSMQKSELYIEALEPSVILEIERKQLIELFEGYPKFNIVFRVLAENAFIHLQKRVLQNISSSAEERYASFLKDYPALFNRVSNVQIAAYIGVTPEFLSVIRNRITKS